MVKMAEEKEWQRWQRKLDEWWKLGYPTCYAVVDHISNKEKSFEEICAIIEGEKIPKYKEMIKKLAKEYSTNN